MCVLTPASLSLCLPSSSTCVRTAGATQPRATARSPSCGCSTVCSSTASRASSGPCSGTGSTSENSTRVSGSRPPALRVLPVGPLGSCVGCSVPGLHSQPRQLDLQKTRHQLSCVLTSHCPLYSCCGSWAGGPLSSTREARRLGQGHTEPGSFWAFLILELLRLDCIQPRFSCTIPVPTSFLSTVTCLPSVPFYSVFLRASLFITVVRFFFLETAFLLSDAHVTAMLQCLEAVEQNNPRLLAQIDASMVKGAKHDPCLSWASAPHHALHSSAASDFPTEAVVSSKTSICKNARKELSVVEPDSCRNLLSVTVTKHPGLKQLGEERVYLIS